MASTSSPRSGPHAEDAPRATPSRVDTRRRDWLRAGVLAAATAGAPATLRAEPRRGLVLALGSGSMHGLAHVGVMRACERLGRRPALVVGSSVGAVVGALWAAGLTSRDMQSLAARLDWQSAASWTLPWRGLRKLDGLREIIAQATGGRRIEQLPRRFAAVATALADGQQVLLQRGPVDEAVAASSAIPVLFEPVRVQGRDLVDASLCAPVPVDAARELGRGPVVAVDVAYRPHEEPAGSLGDIAFQAMHILVNRLADEQVQRADHALRLNLHHLMQHRKDSAEALVDAGDEAMTALLQRHPNLR